MDRFVNLHVHGEGSLLDGYGTAEEIVGRAKELDQGAIALTDHGTMASTLQFYHAARDEGINPLIGMESYVTDDMDVKEKDSPTYHMGIIARNDRGLQKLYRISYWSWNKGFYKKPRFDIDSYSNYFGSDDRDLIVLSGCMDGPISQKFLSGVTSHAGRKCDELAKAFSHFAIEIQPWNPPELNEFLIGLADEKGIPLVVTCDSHRCRPQDRLNAEISLLISQLPSMKESDKDYARTWAEPAKRERDLVNRINMLYPNRRLRFDKYENYIHGRDTLTEIMQGIGLDRTDIYDNTYDMTKDIDVTIESKNYFPKYDKRLDSFWYLKQLAEDGLQDMGLTDDKYRERLADELRVVKKLDFADYFLVVWDIVHYSKSQNIWVGPGRGSVGGSLLAYALGITKVDPLKHGLLFWRFLNIDLDYNPEFEPV